MRYCSKRIVSISLFCVCSLTVSPNERTNVRAYECTNQNLNQRNPKTFVVQKHWWTKSKRAKREFVLNIFNFIVRACVNRLIFQCVYWQHQLFHTHRHSLVLFLLNMRSFKWFWSSLKKKGKKGLFCLFVESRFNCQESKLNNRLRKWEKNIPTIVENFTVK